MKFIFKESIPYLLDEFLQFIAFDNEFLHVHRIVNID